MKETATRVVLMGIFLVGVYFIASLFGDDSSYRGVPDDMVGNCTAYGDCY